MADTPQQPDPEETKAEQHVEEIMGPADPRNADIVMPPAVLDEPSEEPAGVEPEPELESGLEPEAGAVAEPVADEPEAAAEVPAEEVAEDNPVPPIEPAEAEVEPETLPDIDNKTTDKAVDDIMHTDADAALPESTDADAVVMKYSLRERCKNAWFNWWGNPWKKYGTFVVLAAVILVIAFVAPVRAMVLNTIGVRSSVLVRVYDGATNLPLQNAVVAVDSASVKTDANGQAKLTGIHLGKRNVTISKIAFASTTEPVNLGMRIIDIGDVTLKPVGTQLTYVLKDYLSGKPIADVSLASGESTAKSDKDGKAVITVQPNDAKDSKITVSKDGYRSEDLNPPADLRATTEYKLVPAAHAIFVSKESGKYDVYKTYLDGKDRAVLLAGTGLETQAILTLPSSSGSKVAVASTRDDRRNSDGYLLTALNIVDVASGDRVNIDYAEQVSLLGWRGDSLVYLQTVAGASAANPNRQKIVSYDTNSGKRYQLASANYFAGEQLIGNTLYYTVSATDPSAQSSFAQVSIDGSNKKTLFTGTVWSLLRTDYNKMKIQTQDKWYEYTLGASAAAVTTPVSDFTSRFYVDSPDSKTSVWVDARDVNGVLIARNLATSKETELTTQKSLQAPLYWLNDSTVVYRITGSSEVADYAISIDGGQAKKIADVSLTGIR